jgi:hypothetical protein
MRLAELNDKADGSPRERHPKNHGSRSNGRANGSGKSPIKDFVTMGRGLPRRLHRDFEKHPEASLAVVGGASFLAGVILGSRLGRAVLSAAIPFGLQYLLESEHGPRLRAYAEDLLGKVSDARDPS